MRRITDNVFIELDVAGANVGVIKTSEGNVVVDTPHKPTEALAWRRELEKLGPVKYLVCTEHHPDHITGVPIVPGLVIAHEETARKMRAKDPAATRAMVQRMDPAGVALIDQYPPRMPEITFSERMSLFLGDQVIELLPLPGHAAGGIAVYVPRERVVFAGDGVFYKVKSFLQEAETEKWQRSLDLLAGLEVDMIVPGHGDNVCDKQYLREQGRIVAAWVEAVAEVVDKGLTLEAAKEKTPNPDPYAVETGVRFTVKEVNDMNVSNLYKIATGKS